MDALYPHMRADDTYIYNLTLRERMCAALHAASVPARSQRPRSHHGTIINLIIQLRSMFLRHKHPTVRIVVW